MSKKKDKFFEGKRPWSVIKDEVLKNYMAPYLAKVNKRGQPILLIDGYAGPGVFKDETLGSPLLMCEKAEVYAKGNYHAKFINYEKKYHDQLRKELEKRGLSGTAEPLRGDTRQLLPAIARTLTNQTVFLYLDPFGPTGCDFALLQPFLERNSRFSTEILLTMNMPGMPRLATTKAVQDGRQNEQIEEFHQMLTDIFGGDYWKEIMWNQELSTEECDRRLIEAYKKKLAGYLRYIGSCPVRERMGKRIKYFVVFGSNHSDAMILLNDIMAKAYFSHIHKTSFAENLFQYLDWRETEILTTDRPDIDEIIIEMVGKHSGETRASIWLRIIQKYFMRYLEPEYKATVKELVNKQKLVSPDFQRTRRLNDDCTLYLP